MDNSQFTEEQRAEAYRIESMQLMHRQTQAMESTRTYVGWLLAITLILIVLSILSFVAANASNSPY